MFTESQRKRFNAEERTQRGEEQMHEPVEHDTKCYACGGPVDAAGMADGGMVDDESERSEFVGDETPNDRGDTSQSVRSDDMTERARLGLFVRRVRGGR